ncbi:MAG TPA: alpha/beta fold hydrolase [Stellaceae bacterium]|nr:alpha/beta fold hydrolase [Stellaceae bacterium]
MLLPLKGRRIYYDIAGPERGPVLCITHSLASDSGMWGEQMGPLLNAGWRVLRIDMRGHGGSDPVPGDYTMDALADDAAIVLEALGVGPVHYMGLSIGGMFGQSLALRHGDRLKSLLLCDTSGASPPGSKELWAGRIAAVKGAGTLEPIADATVERWLSDKFKARNPKRWRQIRDTVVGTTPMGFMGCGAALMDFDYLPRLPTVRLPTLVVWGVDDPGTPPEANRRIVAAIPGARGEEIADARHFPNVEQPDAFNRILMGWLEARR